MLTDYVFCESEYKLFYFKHKRSYFYTALWLYQYQRFSLHKSSKIFISIRSRLSVQYLLYEMLIQLWSKLLMTFLHHTDSWWFTFAGNYNSLIASINNIYFIKRNFHVAILCYGSRLLLNVCLFFQTEKYAELMNKLSQSTFTFEKIKRETELTNGIS